MKLTIAELKDVIKEVLKSISEEGQKGRDGYVDEDTKPNGFSPGGSMDFSMDSSRSLEGNRYKRQGAANMGPWTNESVLRAVVRNMIKESFKLKPMPNSKTKVSAPFNTRANVGKKGTVGNVKLPEWKTTKEDRSVWESLAHWYSIPALTKESVQGVVEAKLVEKMEAESGQKTLHENISQRKTQKSRRRKKRRKRY